MANHFLLAALLMPGACKMMQVIARKLTDREMRAVAEYISGLR